MIGGIRDTSMVNVSKLVESDEWDGPKHQTCIEHGWITVCNEFEMFRRRNGRFLAWGHHLEVQSLTQQKSKKNYLDECEALRVTQSYETSSTCEGS